FRTRYNGVILAIHRAGTRINRKIGDIVFRPNDTLFILAEKGFDKKWYHTKDFSLVSRSLDIFEKPRWKGNLALGIILLMVLFASLNIMPILLSAAVAATLMVATGILSPENAKKSIDYNVLLYIACSFGIAKAVTNSGLAHKTAEIIVSSLGTLGPAAIAAGIFVLTSLFTWVITNNAVAAIMFPVVLSVSKIINADPRPFMLTLVFAASTCFATPIGYQTNLMVYNAGNYKFTDFFKTGILLNLIVGSMVTFFIYFYFFK
ncbi:SLC13 family permease, partial [candidate division KSB1 bacterium]